jgi:hypothetical protein
LSIDTTTGMSAPPMAITMCTPNSSAITVITSSGSMPAWMSCALQEGAAEPDHHQQAGQVEPVPRRQQQRLAADLARELAEGDDRAGEGDGADQDADVDLHLVDGLLAPVGNTVEVST